MRAVLLKTNTSLTNFIFIYSVIYCSQIHIIPNKFHQISISKIQLQHTNKRRIMNTYAPFLSCTDMIVGGSLHGLENRGRRGV
jgi:hypothetical protein